jgi:ubiquinone/menaquinone biosynthesis C-methylase UbiE
MILEVGCGSTVDYDLKEPENYRVRFKVKSLFADVYLDLAKPEKELMKRIYGDFIRGDAQQLPFQKNTFSEIYASEIIEHLPNPTLFLKECYRTLKKNGCLHVWCPNFFSAYATNKRRGSEEADPTHLHIFTTFSLYNILRYIGFKNITLHQPFATLFPIPRLLRNILIFLFSEEIQMDAYKYGKNFRALAFS